MNFKNYFLIGLLLCGMSACSSDDPVGPEEPALQKAKFAVSVKNDQVVQRTKAEVYSDKTVNKLTVGVFGEGWSTVYTQIPTMSIDGQLSQIGPQEVYAGTVRIVVVANASTEVETALKKATSIDEFLATPITLGDEYLDKGLTMSSQVFEPITIVADQNNYFGYEQNKGEITEDGAVVGVEIKGGGAVELIRDVASVSLKSVTLSRGENYASKSFTLKEVFVASAKSLSSIASTTRWGEIEKSFSIENETDYQKYWVGQTFTGDQASMDEGSYKSGLQTAKDILLKRTLETEDATLNFGSSWFADAVGTTVPSPVGHQFYVYENTKGERLATDAVTGKGNYTLLVVKGDYTYTAKGGEEITDADRYYTVIVNDPTMENTKYDDTVGKHSYVKRNCKYEINLTILGPGSELPYDPMISTNLSASVKVEPWNVKNIHEEVE